MTQRNARFGAAALVLAACAPAPSPLPPPTPTAIVANPTAPPAPTIESKAATRCSADRFVPCESGAACSRRQGELIEDKVCFDRAADACDLLTCEFGCLIYHGAPKEVHCAPNASTTSEGFKRCGGLANWACPEKTRCERNSKAFDGMGTCVPDA